MSRFRLPPNACPKASSRAAWAPGSSPARAASRMRLMAGPLMSTVTERVVLFLGSLLMAILPRKIMLVPRLRSRAWRPGLMAAARPAGLVRHCWYALITSPAGRLVGGSTPVLIQRWMVRWDTPRAWAAALVLGRPGGPVPDWEAIMAAGLVSSRVLRSACHSGPRSLSAAAWAACWACHCRWVRASLPAPRLVAGRRPALIQRCTVRRETPRAWAAALVLGPPRGPVP